MFRNSFCGKAGVRDSMYRFHGVVRGVRKGRGASPQGAHRKPTEDRGTRSRGTSGSGGQTCA